jgi:hypothetical protein
VPILGNNMTLLQYKQETNLFFIFGGVLRNLSIILSSNQNVIIEFMQR